MCKAAGYTRSDSTRQPLPALLLAMALVSCATPAVVDPAALDPALVEASRWYTGETGTVDDVRARSLLERAAADGDALSVMWLARVYSTGRMTDPADKARAETLAASVISAVEQLARQGQAEAEFLLGTAWAEGLGKPVDAAEAAFWYRRAADRGHVLAQHNLGNIHFAGTGVVQDAALAAQWWRLAAEAGDAIPQYRLGNLFEQGLGVSQDREAALRWYRNAAGRGNRDAAAALLRLGAN